MVKFCSILDKVLNRTGNGYRETITGSFRVPDKDENKRSVSDFCACNSKTSILWWPGLKILWKLRA